MCWAPAALCHHTNTSARKGTKLEGEKRHACSGITAELLPKDLFICFEILKPNKYVTNISVFFLFTVCCFHNFMSHPKYTNPNHSYVATSWCRPFSVYVLVSILSDTCLYVCVFGVLPRVPVHPCIGHPCCHATPLLFLSGGQEGSTSITKEAHRWRNGQPESRQHSRGRRHAGGLTWT